MFLKIDPNFLWSIYKKHKFKFRNISSKRTSDFRSKYAPLPNTSVTNVNKETRQNVRPFICNKELTQCHRCIFFTSSDSQKSTEHTVFRCINLVNTKSAGICLFTTIVVSWLLLFYFIKITFKKNKRYS